MSNRKAFLSVNRIKVEVEKAIEKILEKRSSFKITGISGLFEAKKPKVT